MIERLNFAFERRAQPLVLVGPPIVPRNHHSDICGYDLRFSTIISPIPGVTRFGISASVSCGSCREFGIHHVHFGNEEPLAVLAAVNSSMRRRTDRTR